MGQADTNAAGLMVQGNLLNVGRGDLVTARIFTNPYFGALTEQGARDVAHQYAADILKQLGIASLAGSKIYFVSDRTGKAEIWSMDSDGANQMQMTRNRTISFEPTVSADGSLVAYATNINNSWALRVVRTDTGRQQTFVNPVTSTLGTPEFSPDGKRLWFSMVIDNWTQLAVSNVDGGQMARVSRNKAIEFSPKVNPKTGKDLLFISSRAGKPQLYHMNIDGSGAEMISNGQGEVHNPAWSPDGTKVAFSWNKGYVAGDFNIFVMDINNRANPVQLTKESGSNENPSWAPDGLHIVYSNQKGRSTQIYTILANGSRVKQLTSQVTAQGEINRQPVWAKGMN
jgi:TolB protein